jgi:spore coat protein CotH
LAPFGEHSASCNKLSFKIKFDKFVDGQEFLGLKRLQLHAALSDPTYTREVLSYSVFREMGIAAPRGAPSTISIIIGDRRIVMGIYLLTEVIDSKFAATYFPKAAGGNMYKEGWPEMRGNPLIPGDPMDGTRGWEYPLRTNQDEQDLRRANGWSKAMAGVKDDYELVKVVKEYTHVEQMARYIAVDRFIEHWDGPINFRADTAGNFTNGLGEKSEPMGWWPHNFFMYEDGDMPREKKQFQLVAWDTDSTFIAKDKINTLLSIWFPRWDHPICDAGEWSNDGFSENGKDADGKGNPHVCRTLLAETTSDSAAVCGKCDCSPYAIGGDSASTFKSKWILFKRCDSP